MDSYCRHKVLDGGLSTELIEGFRHSEINNDPLWSSRLICSHPNDISQAHEKFLKAGADLIETCTYQASIEGFMKYLGVSQVKAEEIIREGVNLCMEARDRFWSQIELTDKKLQNKKPLVVGSIGPYGAHLADRSEYSGHYVDSLSIEDLKNWHRPQLQIISSCGVDLLAFETLPAKKEALAILELLREFPDCKAWLSFSCKDRERTCRGESMEGVVEDLLDVRGNSSNLLGLGANCFDPDFAESFVGKFRSSLTKRGKLDDVMIVCYPDGGGEWKSDGSWTRGNLSESRVKKWLEAGANWVGGCCMTSPDDTLLMRKTVDEFVANKSNNE